MQQQLYLHIGDCKTGSTAIQTMLKGGLCTAQDLRLFPGHVAHGLANSLGGKSEDYPMRWQNMARRLADAQWDVAVLSSEIFEFSEPKKVCDAIRAHLPDYADTIRVVVYVRPHCARALSRFAENLNLGYDTGDIAQFLDRVLGNGTLNFSPRLARWKEQFGDRLIVRPFVRDQLVRGDVRHDFLALVLQNTRYRLRDGHYGNPSLSLPDLALMRTMQRRFDEFPQIGRENRAAVGKQFAQLLHARPAAQAGDKLRLTGAHYQRIYQACLEDAREMDANWLEKPCFVSELDRGAGEVIEQAQSLEAEDHHSPQTLRLMLTWTDLILRQMADPPKAFGRRMRRKSAKPRLAP